MRSLVKNFSYTVCSNIISFFISAGVTFFVPKVLGVEDYGYFQLYLFYASYTGFFHFGWLDGIYLRYGGKYYEDLDKAKFSAQFYMCCFVELIFAVFFAFVALFYIKDYGDRTVIIFTGICIAVYLPRTMGQYILQITNRIRDYAWSLLVEKFSMGLLIAFFLLGNASNFKYYIFADLMSRSMGLLYVSYQCRDILKTYPEPFVCALRETKMNVKTGISLMFANIASLLIVGIIRFSIEKQWDVSTFGKVSLTMSVSNMLMVVIRAVAMVMFPMLRRTDSKKLAPMYNVMRTGLMIPLLGMMTAYYPVKVILSGWLPQYAESLRYMAILFPMCIFESKMSMLIETYLKALRKEKWLLLVNITTVFISLLFAVVSVFLLNNLNLAILSIVVMLAFRCVFAEMLLSSALKVNVRKDILMEVMLTTTFIVSSWFVGGLIGVLLYLCAYTVYLYIKRKEVKQLFGKILRITK